MNDAEELTALGQPSPQVEIQRTGRRQRRRKMPLIFIWGALCGCMTVEAVLWVLRDAWESTPLRWYGAISLVQAFGILISLALLLIAFVWRAELGGE